nr:hypothetical protein [Tanacetum cinerariifolium]
MNLLRSTLELTLTSVRSFKNNTNSSDGYVVCSIANKEEQASVNKNRASEPIKFTMTEPARQFLVIKIKVDDNDNTLGQLHVPVLYLSKGRRHKDPIMSGTIPHIPPPFRTSFGNLGSPNVNWVDTMPTTTDPINTTTTTNVSQSVLDENLPQLLVSKGGSHVTNVSSFDKEDFTSLKVRFLVFLDGLEPYILKTLEDRPFVSMLSLSTSENPLPKRQNQWSNAESRLANQDKRLKSIIISCLPNDVIKSDSNSDVEEDQRTNNEFMLCIMKELYWEIRRGFIREDELSIRKADARSGQWVDLTMKKVKENQEKDKIGSKPDKNRKRVEAEKSLKQLQWVEEEKLNKTQKEWP